MFPQLTRTSYRYCSGHLCIIYFAKFDKKRLFNGKSLYVLFFSKFSMRSETPRQGGVLIQYAAY